MLEMVTLPGNTGKPYRFEQAGISIAGDQSDNLIIRAFNLLANDFPIPPTDLFLYKKIPMGAGLGGGSADAAFALKLLNTKYQLSLSNQQLSAYAAQLGSDCAFFIDNTSAYLLGKGHELTPYEVSLKGWYLVLLYPNVHSNTALAYRNVQRREVLDPNHNLKLMVKQPVTEWRNQVFNDFEPSVFAAFPQLAQLKQQLYNAGATFALMSGSGSSLFGLFEHKPQLPENLQSLVVYEGELTV